MLDRVDRLQESIKQHEPLDSEVGHWISGAFELSIKTGIPLDKALGINNLRNKWLRRERNRHLFAAWMSLDFALDDWPRSRELARILSRFESGRWRNLRFIKDPPDNLTETQRHLFWAFKTGIEPPKSIKGLHGIVSAMK